MTTLELAARIALAATLAVAGVAKLRDQAGATRTAASLGVPARLAPATATAVCLIELALAIGLVIPSTAREAAAGAAVLLTAFLVALAVQFVRGVAVPCACFGQLRTTAAGGATLLRNSALVGLALFVRAATG